MKKKIIGIFVMMLVIATSIPAVSSLNNNKINLTDEKSSAEFGSFDYWTEQQKLLASDGAAGDMFGFCYLDGDTALITSCYDDDNGVNSGSAYVFTRSGTTWTQEAKLLPSDGAAGDLFGYFSCLSGDTAIIGAPCNDDHGVDSGSAYVFTRSGTTWTQQAKLLASDGTAGDCFGNNPSISGDTAVIGAFYDDDNGVNSGSAYVFTRSGTIWNQQAKLLPSDGTAGDQFGQYISLLDDTVLIGAWYDDDNGIDSGSAYVFTRSGTTWNQQAKLLPLDGAAGDWFGTYVSLDVDTALIGAPLDDSYRGSAYVFTRSGTTWTQQAKLLASDGAMGDAFGASVSISGDTAVIGAIWDDDKGVDSGSAYVFVRSGTTWTQQAKLLASDGAAGDEFGYFASLSGGTALIGAWLDDDMGVDSGSAYVFIKLTENQPPEPPIIDGPPHGKVKTVLKYNFTSIDPDRDDIAEYIVNWGDETGDETITGPFTSGQTITADHTWTKKGDYVITAKAKDIYGAESNWSTLEITVPRDRSINNLFFRLLDQFIHFFQIVRYLL